MSSRRIISFYLNNFSLSFPDRNFHLGVAMIMIILFHITGKYDLVPFKFFISKGFYGVDVFLFFSAYGLSFSYNKKSLKKFYIKRAIRILPAFYLLIVFRIAWHVLYNDQFNLREIIVTILGVSYFKFLEGIRIDWYLSALILLYLFFPLFFKTMKRLNGLGGALFSICSSVICLSIPMHWEYQCLIGRIPIYALGIYCYLHRNTYLSEHRFFAYYILFGITLFIVDILMPNSRTRFLAPAFICPVLIFLFSWILKYLHDNCFCLINIFRFIGNHTLEIYVGNVISMVICYTGIGLRGTKGALMDMLINALFAWIIYRINIFVQERTEYKRGIPS